MEPILKASINEISEDTKLIRLATLTTFVHSLLFILYLLYLVFQVASLLQGSDNAIVLAIQNYGMQIAENPTLIVLFVIISLIALVGYYLLPPIGEAAIIFYLDSSEKGGTVSFGKGVNRFFPMFEFDAAVSLFNVLIFGIVASRMRAMGILGQPLVIIVMCIWMIVIFMTSLFLPYTRMIITLEHENFLDAMRQSMHLAIRHIGITFRYVIINYILSVRFVINILIVVGVPLVLVYFALSLGILHNIIIQTIGAIIISGLILLTAYINGIIEAFFMTYWYKVYSHIKSIPD